MSTYVSTSTCQKVKTRCLSGTCFEPKEDKESVMSKLKSRISKLEQQENDYQLLQQEYKQIENEYTLLNEAYLRLEYEIKQRDEACNKRIVDLKSENENLQLGLNDRICVNKKLSDEKKCLENQLQIRNDEIADLKNKLNNLTNRLKSTDNDKNNLNNTINELNGIKSKQRDKIADLVNDNKKLAKICQDQDHSLYAACQEKQKLSGKLNDDDANINNLNIKIKSYSNNLSNLKNELNCSNELNFNLKNKEKDLENCLAKLKIDYNNLKNEYNKEKTLRQNEDKQNEELKMILNDKEKKLNALNNDYLVMKETHEKTSVEEKTFQIENDKLNEHVEILTKSNQDLCDEIDRVIKDDGKMKMVLNRSDRMTSLLKVNDNILAKMPNDIMSISTCSEENVSLDCQENNLALSQTVKKERNCSPNYTYFRSEKKI